MKYSINYYEFKNCPEATEISKNRQTMQFYLLIACVACLFICLPLSFVDSADRWIAICGIIISVLGFVYLFTHYNKVTKRKIEKALSKVKNEYEE